MKKLKDVLFYLLTLICTVSTMVALALCKHYPMLASSLDKKRLLKMLEQIEI